MISYYVSRTWNSAVLHHDSLTDNSSLTILWSLLFNRVRISAITAAAFFTEIMSVITRVVTCEYFLLECTDNNSWSLP